jgi:predicted Zn-dependent protease
MNFLRIFVLFMVFNTSIFPELKQHSIIVDARAEKLIKNILERLCTASGRLSVPKIYFIVDKNINAFATDEAKIFIHTGLIIQFKTVDQLIAVLAHELGHITGGHIHRMSSEMRGATAASIIGTLLGGAAALAGAGIEGLIAGTMLGQGAAMGTFASFSRTHEKEADAAGFRMMQAAGFSTQGFIDTFELFKKMNMMGEPPYLKTHPSDQERIDTVKNFREQSPDTGSIPEEMTREFEIIQAIFKTNLQKASEVERFYYGKDTPAAKIAKVIILSRKGQYNEAFVKLENMITDSPNNPYLHEMYGQFLLESGNAQKAVDHLKKAVNLASEALSIRLLYAQALFTSSSDNAQEALNQLNRITRDDPDNIMAWMLKVGAYRKLNQNSSADLAHAEALMRTGNISLAKQRAKRAQKSENPKVKEQATMLLEDSRLSTDAQE